METVFSFVLIASFFCMYMEISMRVCGSVWSENINNFLAVYKQCGRLSDEFSFLYISMAYRAFGQI